jgi:hypothetical protein
MTRSPQVVFDFTGSLDLARRSWRLADQLEQLGRQRGTRADAALVGWLGPYAFEFIRRIDSETQDAAHLAAQLRAEADGWATEWKKAMDQENYNRYQDACDRARADRDTWDNVKGFFVGHDDLPKPPALAAAPSAPAYTATRQFAHY